MPPKGKRQSKARLQASHRHQQKDKAKEPRKPRKHLSQTRQDRADTARETLEILKEGCYRIDDENLVDISGPLNSSVENSHHYTEKALQNIVSTKNVGGKTRISVTDEKSLAAAERLIVQEGRENVALLNFASAKNPGGGFLGGSLAQEESIAVASGLYASLIPHQNTFYHKPPPKFYKHDMIYSPGVPIFRDADIPAELIPFYTVDIVTAAAVNTGEVKRQEPDRVDEIPSIMKERMELMFRLASERNVKTFILGAWGCGVFGNNPTEIASWFQETIQNHQGSVEEIVFACYGPNKNREAFERIFPLNH